jgi:LysR family transcriptional regulator, hypochlorite-specific transcription factor HypT
MRLEWLEDILAVAETGSFSEAAERRHLTQSAFSRRIRQIEDQIGVELFDRSRKPVQLNPTTAARRDDIARLAAELRRLSANLRLGARSAAQRLVITSQHALGAAFTPAILARLQVAHPGLHTRLRSANLDECFSQLLAREADLAIVYRLPGEDHPVRRDFVETIHMGADRLVPVIAVRHADRAREGVLAGRMAYVAYPHEVFLGRVVERAILPRLTINPAPIPRAETALTLAALEMAAQGLGVAWVPQSLAGGRIDAGILADLSDFLPTCELEVTAVRLSGPGGGIAAQVWETLQAPAA